MNGFHLVLIAAALVLAPLGAETAAAQPSPLEDSEMLICVPGSPGGTLCIVSHGCIFSWWDFCI